MLPPLLLYRLCSWVTLWPWPSCLTALSWLFCCVLVLLHWHSWRSWALATLVTLGEGHFISFGPLFCLQRCIVWSSQCHLICPSKALTAHFSQGLTTLPPVLRFLWFLWGKMQCRKGTPFWVGSIFYFIPSLCVSAYRCI